MIQFRPRSPEAFCKKRLSHRQLPQHLITDPQNDPAGRIHFLLRGMIFVHDILIDQQEISLPHPHRPVLDQGRKFPLYNIDQLIKIMIMERHRSDRLPYLLIDLIVTAQHILPFVRRIPAAQAAFSVHDHPFSLLYHSVQFLFSMVYIPYFTI